MTLFKRARPPSSRPSGLTVGDGVTFQRAYYSALGPADPLTVEDHRRAALAARLSLIEGQKPTLTNWEAGRLEVDLIALHGERDPYVGFKDTGDFLAHVIVEGYRASFSDHVERTHAVLEQERVQHQVPAALLAAWQFTWCNELAKFENPIIAFAPVGAPQLLVEEAAGLVAEAWGVHVDEIIDATSGVPLQVTEGSVAEQIAVWGELRSPHPRNDLI